MPVFGPSVRTWSHRAASVVVQTGSRLVAHATAALAGCGGRPIEQRRVEVAAPHASSGTAHQPPSASPPPVAARAPGVPVTSETQGQRPAPAPRAVTASVTPAMVRRWAHERGIAVADRGRIPRSVMEQYLAQVASESARRTGRASAKGRRSPSGGSHSPAA
ncbi:MAG: histone-like nucleoid-structuring protein Lsr2 [Mycobacterium leprae]